MRDENIYQRPGKPVMHITAFFEDYARKRADFPTVSGRFPCAKCAKNVPVDNLHPHYFSDKPGDYVWMCQECP